MNKRMMVAIAAVLLVAVTGCGKKKEEPVAVPAVDEQEVTVVDEDDEAENFVEEIYEDEETTEEVKEEETSDLKETPEADEEITADEEETEEIDEEYEARKTEVLNMIEEAKQEHNLPKAQRIALDAIKDYPEDEFFTSTELELRSHYPSELKEEDIINKKSCQFKYIHLTDSLGELGEADFSISLGGGSLSANLAGRYEYLMLCVLLSNQSPTKALVDIDIYGDGNLLYSTKDYNTEIGKKIIRLDVSGIDTLVIDSADHHHDWVGEASFSKPDSDCHFVIRLYDEDALEWIDEITYDNIRAD